MRTPSPGVHKFAPMQFSPEVQLEEAEEEGEEEEDWGEREVELAGGSSRDYSQSTASLNMPALKKLTDIGA